MGHREYFCPYVGNNDGIIKRGSTRSYRQGDKIVVRFRTYNSNPYAITRTVYFALHKEERREYKRFFVTTIPPGKGIVQHCMNRCKF